MNLEFSTPHWSLDQAKAWALTRDPELVSWAAQTENFKGAPVALATRVALYMARAKKRGFDINAELWRTSGRSLPVDLPDETDGEDGPEETQRPRRPERNESARLPLFPIEDHFVQLLRAGKIKSLGKRPSDTRHEELSPADWIDLNIAELVGLSVAKSGATCLFVALSQADVLREYPPLTEKAESMTNAPSDQEIGELLRAWAAQNGSRPGLKEGAKIVQNSYPHVSRDTAREHVTRVFGKRPMGRPKAEKSAT